MNKLRELLLNKNVLCIILIALFFSGCIGVTEEVHGWFDMLAKDMDRGDLFVTVLLASFVAGLFN